MAAPPVLPKLDETLKEANVSLDSLRHAYEFASQTRGGVFQLAVIRSLAVIVKLLVIQVTQ